MTQLGACLAGQHTEALRSSRQSGSFRNPLAWLFSGP
jgi:hypothetical protein